MKSPRGHKQVAYQMPIIKEKDKKRVKQKKTSPISICPHEKQCGGCQLLHISYKEQLKLKQGIVNSLLNKYGEVSPILGMENPYFYRNKVHAVYKQVRKGEIKAGIYEQGTHHVIQNNNCLIENKKADEILQTIYELVRSFKLSIFNEDTLEGFFRHVLIRTGKNTGEILVVLVTSSFVFPCKKAFLATLINKHPEITSIVLNVNASKTNMVLGEREKVLIGKGYIEDLLCGYRFKISPKSFYQVNPLQTQMLYQKAIDLAKLSKDQIIIDAYCGIGTIGLIASSYVKQVISVELNPTAIKDAVINAKLNDVTNVSFKVADASDFMCELSIRKQRVDVVFMDPPRAGSDQRFLDALLRLNPKKVIYISCSPETLKRDLEYLVKHDYKVEQMVPVDMFPHTKHVETVVKLGK